ncbi:dihydrodipicolinate synthase family protein [Jiangella asiatica]|uniref:Dihydrodipicolinate synthase family protein n=1 Tax=Jiangella asiatica TaxID=2530372 RepID=A0A4R5DVQ5_9ACTN|nr:dihydrodipicolinate synthase family protein [Jiangella asiatica]TDE15113.1 hypothetical protein E1269_02085 [Jiangella asiatica]
MIARDDLFGPLTGQPTALITRYADDGSVDPPGFDNQPENRVKCLVAAGTSGQSSTLTPDERLQLISTLVEEMGDDGVTIVGISADRPADAMAFAEAAADAGDDLVLATVPKYAVPATRATCEARVLPADPPQAPLHAASAKLRRAIEHHVTGLSTTWSSSCASVR